MDESPNPVNRKRLSRAMIFGLGLASLGIILFVVLWGVLGNTAMDQFPRLIISLCIPPTVIAALIGIYMLLRPGSGDL